MKISWPEDNALITSKMVKNCNIKDINVKITRTKTIKNVSQYIYNQTFEEF